LTGVAATLSVAGCSGGDGGDAYGGGGGGEETTTTEETTAGSDSGVPDEVSEYLSETGNFDGTVADETGSGNVEVQVGAEGNDGNFAFAPPAVRIDAGTDINWTWTGEGGQHNVVHEDGAFESDLIEEGGNDFQHTFEEPGVYLYFCNPHGSLGMKGAVIVV
jgi:halocyanin-like protein